MTKNFRAFNSALRLPMKRKASDSTGLHVHGRSKRRKDDPIGLAESKHDAPLDFPPGMAYIFVAMLLMLFLFREIASFLQRFEFARLYSQSTLGFPRRENVASSASDGDRIEPDDEFAMAIDPGLDDADKHGLDDGDDNGKDEKQPRRDDAPGDRDGKDQKQPRRDDAPEDQDGIAEAHFKLLEDENDDDGVAPWSAMDMTDELHESAPAAPLHPGCSLELKPGSVQADGPFAPFHSVTQAAFYR